MSGAIEATIIVAGMFAVFLILVYTVPESEWQESGELCHWHSVYGIPCHKKPGHGGYCTVVHPTTGKHIDYHGINYKYDRGDFIYGIGIGKEEENGNP
jgi:hypothetical protein